MSSLIPARSAESAAHDNAYDILMAKINTEIAQGKSFISCISQPMTTALADDVAFRLERELREAEYTQISVQTSYHLTDMYVVVKFANPFV